MTQEAPLSQRLTPQQVRHVAKLSRLTLSEAEVEEMARKLSAVLDYVAQLSELDVQDVEPMAHAMDLVNVFRDDEPSVPLSVAAVLDNAPDPEAPFFKVPKVLGEGSGA